VQPTSCRPGAKLSGLKNVQQALTKKFDQSFRSTLHHQMLSTNMKLSFSAFFLAAATAIVSVDSKQVVGTPVCVEVKCDGLDIEKLDAVSGTVLM
jgi:hypothetical protein